LRFDDLTGHEIIEAAVRNAQIEQKKQTKLKKSKTKLTSVEASQAIALAHQIAAADRSCPLQNFDRQSGKESIQTFFFTSILKNSV